MELRRKILLTMICVGWGSSSINAKENILNVSQFGDIPDENASYYIQKLINIASSKGAVLRFDQKKIYYVSHPIQLPSDLTIDFGNCTFRRTSGAIFNILVSTDTTGLNVSNLVIDGNKDVDKLTAVNSKDRFGGIVLTRVVNSTFKNIQVNNTVNAEDGRAAFYLQDCKYIDLINIGGSGNDRSCIYIYRSRVRLFGSITSNNLGSGITSQQADDCEYYNCITSDFGYSGISINGKRSKAIGLVAYNGRNKGYSGINIGHDEKHNLSDYTVIENIETYNNAGWGVTVVGSKNISVKKLVAKYNRQSNIQIMKNASNVSLANVNSYSSSSGSGLSILSGIGHSVSSSKFHSNAFHGINIEPACGVDIFGDVDCYNNGQSTSSTTLFAGILCRRVGISKISVSCFDNQIKKTQDFGAWIIGGNVNLDGNFKNNKLLNVKRDT